jgi:hypothetical protein
VRTLLVLSLLAGAAAAEAEPIERAIHLYLAQARVDEVRKDKEVVRIRDELAEDPYTLRDIPQKKRQPSLFVSLGIWTPRLRGPVTINGKTYDLAKELGLNNHQVSFVPRVTGRIGRLEITLEGYNLDWGTAVTILDEEIELPDDGGTIPVGATVGTTFELALYRLQFGLIVWKSRPLTVTLGVGLGVYETEGELFATFNQNTWTVPFRATLPVPVFSLGAGGFAGPLFYEFELLGIGISLEEIGAEAVDGRINLGYVVNDYLAVRVGYRFTWIRARVEKITIEISLLDGFFFDLVFFW